ncbi:Malto-oligosyltrehalose trehalohydrolase [Posidoniimonas corsicana]|uniref:Malto-oligosyltrehalose trehalohydrolase n=1 Tax=Posidoniimonas corsicana TaxID=1938618 RepID=A0A5C5VDD2_9BACT|nr:malto-oligosyltrehalose trehalohydrolase [Posidoniimonas corsicana]TWT35909.1 Malto-oligosyltrehalose trehalohydrolase [Posidoniimonas corsicana]
MSTQHRRVLATDLDGTLIPLDGDEQNPHDLGVLADQLRTHDVSLVFVTGRHFESAFGAIEQFGLPAPETIVCDVGTSIFHREADGQFAPVAAYADHLGGLIAPLPIAELRERLSPVAGLRVQEDEKQGPFKLSYYSDADQLERLADQVQKRLDELGAPYSLIHSVDPFNNDGLLDLLPRGVSKAHALEWWIDRCGWSDQAVVFCGDSGNDYAALTAGYNAVVVANADRQLARRVHDAHRAAGWTNRLRLASGTASSGVLEGARWFGLIDPGPPPADAIGAVPVTSSTASFRVWAPTHETVGVQLDGGQRFELTKEPDGCFAGVGPAAPGDKYQYLLHGQTARPDPVSRRQPEGVHGPSEVVDANAFAWTDQTWTGVDKRDLVIYEMHPGAFTEEGTLRSAIARLPELVDLGVTAVEVMPVAQSPGKWNWGYDGVNLYAVTHNYGAPDDFRAFVDACHAAGLAVILDVVYNHLGPEGNYLSEFAPYFSRKHHTPWGAALNYDGRRSEHVRRFVVENALYWLRDLHLDGLRLDAVHFMHDDSQHTILDEIRVAVADFEQSAGRAVHLIGESNVYDERLLASVGGLKGYDAIWSDCLMHSIYTHASPDFKLTNREYHGAHNLREALDHGYLYESSQYVRVAREALGGDLPDRSYLPSLVTALQTHDSVGNHPEGKRIHQLASKEYQRSAAALMLLYPSIPLLFMGEESAVDAPFPFFADFHDRRLRRAVDKGRMAEYPHHDWKGAPLPSERQSFRMAKCHDPSLQDQAMRDWYRQLLALRKQGLAAGWLTPEAMSCAHDDSSHVFRLQYDSPAGGPTVLARLTPNHQPADPIELPIDGRVTHSSLPLDSESAGRVRLAPNHAVIVSR